MSNLDPLQMLLDAAEFIKRDKPEWAKAARAAVAASRVPAPTGRTLVDPDLVQRCKELLEWSATGLLNGGSGGSVRNLAAEWEPKVGDIQALNIAESKTRDEAMAALVRIATAHSPSAAMTDWQDISTAPKDGTEILILTNVGATQARFAAGEWHDYAEGREYDGPAWVCCDDQWQIEIEDCGNGEFHHGEATNWMPLPPSPVARNDRSASEVKP